MLVVTVLVVTVLVRSTEPLGDLAASTTLDLDLPSNPVASELARATDAAPNPVRLLQHPRLPVVMLPLNERRVGGRKTGVAQRGFLDNLIARDCDVALLGEPFTTVWRLILVVLLLNNASFTLDTDQFGPANYDVRTLLQVRRLFITPHGVDVVRCPNGSIGKGAGGIARGQCKNRSRRKRRNHRGTAIAKFWICRRYWRYRKCRRHCN